jgi:hypothetical protein
MFGRLATIIVGLAAVCPITVHAAESSLICRNAGHEYRVGDYACIAACHGKRRYARCDTVADKASWTFISDVCPSASLTPPDPARTTLMPVESAMTPTPVVITMCAADPSLLP